MNTRVEIVNEVGTFGVGEGPHWDSRTKSLYLVDHTGHSIHKYTPTTKQHASVKFDKMVSFIIPVEGRSNQFMIGMVKDIKIITWDGVNSEVTSMETLTTINSKYEILNDAKADSLGNLWTGTFGSDVNLETYSPSRGCLYNLGPKNILEAHVTNVCLSNGIAFSNDSKTLYYIDAALKRVDQFNYDIHNETVSNRQTLFTLEKHNIKGCPHGQTIDADGNLWIAIIMAGKVIKIDTRKCETLLCSISLPEQHVTSVAFGGEKFDELYVTTTSLKLPGTDENIPLKGHLYKISGPGINGLPAYKVKIRN